MYLVVLYATAKIMERLIGIMKLILGREKGNINGI